MNRLIADLEQQQIKVWIDKQGLKPGTRNWENALREAIQNCHAVLLIASPDSRSSNYVQDELALAEMWKRPVYPVWAAGDQWMECIPMGMGKVQFIDARGEQYKNAVTEVVKTVVEGEIVVSQETVTPTPQPTVEFVPQNPYKGLDAFTSEDTSRFFGRETLVNELLTSIQSQTPHFLGIIGPSGSGKSSLVMAGMLPKLKAGALTNSQRWLYLDRIQPGVHPIELFADALYKVNPNRSYSTIETDLKHPSGRGLHNLARNFVPSGDKLVIYVDQFEEVFTQTIDETERAQLISLLTTAATEPDSMVLILLTLRADFYDRPLAYPELGKLLETNGRSILPMSLADLNEVIQKPAALPEAQLSFEDGLVSELVFETRDQVGGLPLLQFTLDQLFTRREGLRLTWNAYKEIGGLRGALAKHAEDTYSKLNGSQQDKLARALFLRLIEPGINEQDTVRRRAALNELVVDDPQQTILYQEVVNRFISARLLTTGRSANVETVEVAHEALIREWPRLAHWLREAREDIAFQRDITDNAHEWSRRGQPEDRLYRGTLLEEANDWASRNVASKLESDFIRASVQNAEAAQVRERRRQRALYQARLGVMAAVAIIALLGLSFFAVQSQTAQNMADQQAAQAKTVGAQALTSDFNAQQAATNAQQAVERANDAATARGEALGQANIAGTQAAIATAAQGQAIDQANIAGTQAAIATGAQGEALDQANIAGTQAAIATAAQGQALVKAGEAQTQAAIAASAQYEAQNNAAISEANLRDAWKAQSLFLANLSRQQAGGSPQLALLLALESLKHYADGIYDAESGTSLLNALDMSVQEKVFMQHSASVTGAAYNQAESRVLTWSKDGSLNVWQANSGKVLWVSHHGDAINGAVWSNDEQHILSWSQDGTARVWDASTGTQVLMLRHAAAVKGAIWKGDRIISWSTDDPNVYIWNANDGSQIFVLRHQSTVSGVLLSSNGENLFSWAGGTLHLWDTTGTLLNTFIQPSNSIDGIALNADESRVVVWGNLLSTDCSDGCPSNLSAWDWNSGESWIFDQTRPIGGAAWSNDSSQILSWPTFSGNPQIWDVATKTVKFDLKPENSNVSITGAAWSHDGKRILMWSFVDAEIWEADTGKLLNSIAGGANRAIWDSEDKQILLESTSNSVVVWNAASNSTFVTISYNNPITMSVWSQDAQQILVTSEDGSARIWNLHPAQKIIIRRDFGYAKLNHDGSKILSYDNGGTIYITDARTGETLLSIPRENDLSLRNVIWSPDELKILSWSDSGVLSCSGKCAYGLTVWDAVTGNKLVDIDPGTAIQSAIWNHDGTAILGWDYTFGSNPCDSKTQKCLQNTVQIWDAKTGTKLFTLDHNDHIWGAKWNQDESRILTWNQDGTAKVWDAATGKLILDLRHKKTAYGLDGAKWNQDESRILTWGDDRTVRVWDAKTGTELLQLHHLDRVWSAVWNADESRILSSAKDGTARVWDAKTGTELLTLRHANSEYGVDGAAWDKDEKHILSWGDDKTVRIWDAKTGASIAVLEHTGRVNQVEWSPDKSQFLTFSQNSNEVRLWDAASFKLSLTMGEAFMEAHWTPDGKHILAVTTSSFTIWPVDIASLIEMGKKQISRELTNAERAQFFLPIPTVSATLAVPTLIPLPTLTPSSIAPTLTPLPTMTSTISPESQLTFKPLPLPEVEGYTLSRPRYKLSPADEYKEQRDYIAPGQTAQENTYSADGKANIFVIQSDSIYPTLASWRTIVNVREPTEITALGEEEQYFIITDTSIFAFFIHNGVFVAVIATGDSLDREAINAIIENTIRQS